MQYPTTEAMYSAFGLNITSAFDLPELKQVYDREASTDVVIRKKKLAADWSALANKDDSFIIKPTFVMFKMKDVAIYLIRNGNEVFVSPIGDVREDQLRLYLLGTCMGAILLQRRILPLHGSAIAVNGKAFAVVGNSGAGKSTLASAFLQRGYELISDDVIPVEISNEGIPMITPAYPQQKLWQESLNQFGMESNHLRPIVSRETKFAVPITDQFVHKQMPLAGVIELVKTEDHTIDMFPVQNLERFYMLFYHTYRNFFVEQMGLLEWHFNISAKAIHSIKMFHLQRPSSRFTANELVDIILNQTGERERVI